MSRLPEPAPALSFQFLAEIASGATTRVDLCRSMGPHRVGELLAVKRLHPHLAEDPSIATRFLDEVWMTAALKHPNVVEVAGWGNDGQGTYLAVELVQGVSLARLMKTVFETGEVFPERLIVHIVAHICRGLAAAHGLRGPDGALLNLVHRDLTPANVILGFKGEVKIADFGLAKSALRMTRTLTGALKGEPTYMSPEQSHGLNVDRRSDIFSLGVILFELFAGKHPWSAASEYEMVNIVTTQPPADLRELRPKIDKELVAIVMRCLERDPAARSQSADEVLARLDSWLRGHGYVDGSEEALGRFVRRNAMRQMRWFERAVSGNLAAGSDPARVGAMPLTGAIRSLPLDGGGRGTTSRDVRRAQPPSSRVGASDDEATDFDAKVASYYPPPKPPRIREAETIDEQSHGDELPTGRDWGTEEGPTIIKPSLRVAPPAAEAPARQQAVAPQPVKAAVQPPASPLSVAVATQPSTVDAPRGRSRGRHPSYYSIVEEDSDQRTTSVKPPLQSGTIAAVRAPVVPQRAASGDFESEELPTVPISPALVSEAQTARQGRQGGVSTPSGIVPIGGRDAALGPDALPKPRTPPRLDGSAQYALPPPSQPPVFGARGNGDASTGPLSPYGLAQQPQLTPTEIDAERIARQAQATPEIRERLQAQADRLTVDASRLREEARLAVAQADRRVAMANVASHVATMAGEALRISTSSGALKASRHLDEALALEQAMHRLAAAPLSLAPDAGVGPISSGHEQHEMLAQLGLGHLESPPFLASPMGGPRSSGSSRPPPRPASSRPPPPHAARAASGAGATPSGPRSRPLRRSGFPAANSALSTPIPLSGAVPHLETSPAGRHGAARSEMGVPVYGGPMEGAGPFGVGPAPHDVGAAGHAGQRLSANSDAALANTGVPAGTQVGTGTTNLDALTFRARLQPMFLGVPRTVAVAVAAAAFTVVLLLLWLFFS